MSSFQPPLCARPNIRKRRSRLETGFSDPPGWLKVETTEPFRWRNALGAGESEAIALALAHRPDIFLVDDREARLAALDLGIQTMGTLGILGLAAEKGLLDFSATIAELKKTNMHLPEGLVEQVAAKLKK